MYSRIVATGSYLPEKVMTNQDLEKIVDTTDDWIVKRVGIKSRHVLSEQQTTSDMAIAAAQVALETAGIDANDIDMVICGTVSSELSFPSVACLVQKALGMTNDAPAFDVSAACAGFIFALNLADQSIRSRSIQRALVIGVEALTKMVDWQDRSTCVLFGDGAGAVIVEASDEPGILASTIHSSGAHVDMLYANDPRWTGGSDASTSIQMVGGDTFKLAVTKLNDIVGQTLALANLSKSDIDWLIPHQANMRIIQAIAKRLDLPMSQVVLTIEAHGNTSSASVPLALDTAVRSGQVKRGETVLLEAFGAGLAWGASLLVY